MIQPMKQTEWRPRLTINHFARTEYLKKKEETNQQSSRDSAFDFDCPWVLYWRCKRDQTEQ